jgi:hypothetical protein
MDTQAVRCPQVNNGCCRLFSALYWRLLETACETCWRLSSRLLDILIETVLGSTGGCLETWRLYQRLSWRLPETLCETYWRLHRRLLDTVLETILETPGENIEFVVETVLETVGYTRSGGCTGDCRLYSTRSGDCRLYS